MNLSWLFTIGCGIVSIVGAIVLCRALRGGRRRGRCTACNYPITGTIGHAACPECGVASGSPAAARAKRRRIALIVLGMSLLLVLPARFVFAKQLRECWWRIAYTRWTHNHTVTFDQWTVCYYKGGRPNNDWERRAVVLRGDLVVMDLDDDSRGAAFMVEPGGDATLTRADVTGDGSPEVFFETYSLGNHCCGTLHVLSESAESPLLARITTIGDGPKVIDLDRDGVSEICVWDQTYRGWRSSMAESPIPEVALAWNGSEFAPSARHMREASAADARTVAADALNQPNPFNRWPPTPVWIAALEQMYRGHESLAWRILDEAERISGRDLAAFRRDFAEQLAASPYWPALKAQYDRDRRAP